MIRRFLDLSTAHVSEETGSWLDRQTLPDLATYPHVHEMVGTGWFVWADPDPSPETQVPDDLRALFTYARSQNCDYILLDRDAETLDELPTFDW